MHGRLGIAITLLGAFGLAFWWGFASTSPTETTRKLAEVRSPLVVSKPSKSESAPKRVPTPPAEDPHATVQRILSSSLDHDPEDPEDAEQGEWRATLAQLDSVLANRPEAPIDADRVDYRDYQRAKGERLNHLKALEFDLLEQLKVAPSLDRTIEIELALATLYTERAQDIDHLYIPDHYSDTRAAGLTALAEERSLKNFEKAELMNAIAEHQAGSLPSDSPIHALLDAHHGG